MAAGPRGDGPLVEGEVGVGHHQLGGHLVAGAEAVAAIAGAVGRVEREVARRQLLEAAVAVGADEVLGERERLGVGQLLELVLRGAGARAGDDLDLGHAVGELEGGLEGVGEPPLDAVAAHQAVDDDLDGVLLVAGEVDGLAGADLDEVAVDPGPGEALAGEVLQEGLVGALAPPDHRRQHLEAGALGELEDAVDDLLGRLAGDGGAALRAVGLADAGPEQAEVVVDLGDGADGGARVAAGGLLVDGDGRRQPLDEVDVGLVHLAEELPGVGREGLDVAALALGVDGVEGERRLARAGQAREDDELVAGRSRSTLRRLCSRAPRTMSRSDIRSPEPSRTPVSFEGTGVRRDR